MELNNTMTETEQWNCGDCGYIEEGPIDVLVGKKVTKTIGEGRREKTIETVQCPCCGSDDWHSTSVRDIQDVI